MLKVGGVLSLKFFKNLSSSLKVTTLNSFRTFGNEATLLASTKENSKLKEDLEEKRLHHSDDPLQSLADYLNLNVDYSNQSKERQVKKRRSQTPKSNQPIQPNENVYENLVNTISTFSSSSTSSQLEEESKKFAEEVIQEKSAKHQGNIFGGIRNKNIDEKQHSFKKYSNKLSSHFEVNNSNTKYVDNEEEIKKYASSNKHKENQSMSSAKLVKTNLDEEYRENKSTKITEKRNKIFSPNKNVKEKHKEQRFVNISTLFALFYPCPKPWVK